MAQLRKEIEVGERSSKGHEGQDGLVLKTHELWSSAASVRVLVCVLLTVSLNFLCINSSCLVSCKELTCVNIGIVHSNE